MKAKPRKAAKVTEMERDWRKWIRLDNWHKMEKSMVHLMKIAFQAGYCKHMERVYKGNQKQRRLDRLEAIRAERKGAGNASKA